MRARLQAVARRPIGWYGGAVPRVLRWCFCATAGLIPDGVGRPVFSLSRRCSCLGVCGIPNPARASSATVSARRRGRLAGMAGRNEIGFAGPVLVTVYAGASPLASVGRSASCSLYRCAGSGSGRVGGAQDGLHADAGHGLSIAIRRDPTGAVPDPRCCLEQQRPYNRSRR